MKSTIEHEQEAPEEAPKPQSLYDYLEENGHLEFGSVFPRDLVREFVGAEVTEEEFKGTFKDAQRILGRLSIKELNAITPVRKRLLSHGRYLAQVKENYRVLLPSENEAQYLSMINSGFNKIRAAGTLKVNSPVPVGDAPGNQKGVLAEMYLHGQRKH